MICSNLIINIVIITKIELDSTNAGIYITEAPESEDDIEKETILRHKFPWSFKFFCIYHINQTKIDIFFVRINEIK